jgi:hypothetical protein
LTVKPLSAAALARKGFPAQCQTTTFQNRPRKIYVVPQNQAQAMSENTESKAATKVINGRINGRFAKGYSGNPGGSPEATRRAFNKRFLLDLAEDWQQHGREVFKRVRRESPASYLKVCAMLVPREFQVEHSGGVKAMTDEQIEQAIEAIQTMLAARDGEAAKVIEGAAELAALPAPNGPSPEAALKATLEPTKRKPNRLTMEADTAANTGQAKKTPPGPRSHDVPGGRDDRE